MIVSEIIPQRLLDWLEPLPNPDDYATEQDYRNELADVLVQKFIDEYKSGRQNTEKKTIPCWSMNVAGGGLQVTGV